MQAGRRLVEDVERPPGRDLRQLGRELDALRLAARQRRRRLAEADVAEADVVERLQPAADLRDVLEELERLLDGHVEHVGDRLALEADVERLAVVALAVALLARHVDVGQEVHLDLDLAVAAADLAAPALDVEREAARLVAARPRLLRLGEQVADDVEQARVRRRVRARRAPDRRLVDLDDLVELVEAEDRRVRARPLPRAVQPVGRRALNSTSLTSVDLPEPDTPVTHVSTPSGTLHVDRLEVVLRRAADLDVARRHAPLARAPRSTRVPRQELAGQRLRDPLDLVRRALGDDLAAVLAGARARCRRGGRRRASSARRARRRSPCCRGRAGARASPMSLELSRWCRPIDGSSRM